MTFVPFPPLVRETPPVWRDNKTVLWLVRIGFILQFYIPAAVCCGIIIWASCADETKYFGYTVISTLTLALLAVQWGVFTPILRYLPLRSAWRVLVCLIHINVLHGAIWLAFGWQWTFIRLIPPTVLYIIAIIVEQTYAYHEHRPYF